MARISIYIPDTLNDEMRGTIGSEESVSRFIQEAVDARLEPLRAHCPDCGRVMLGTWEYCPFDGSELPVAAMESALQSEGVT